MGHGLAWFGASSVPGLVDLCLPRPFGCCAQVPVRLPSGTSRPSLSAWQMSSSTRPRWVRVPGGSTGCLPTSRADLCFPFQGSSNSYAIKKKDELERVAKSNR